MAMTIGAGKLRHEIEWYEQGDGTDDYGRPLGKTKIYDTILANVRVTSGSQLAGLGAALTDEIITVLTWYDPRINNSHFIKWNNLFYEIQHIKQGERLREMLITAKVQRDG